MKTRLSFDRLPLLHLSAVLVSAVLLSVAGCDTKEEYRATRAAWLAQSQWEEHIVERATYRTELAESGRAFSTTMLTSVHQYDTLTRVPATASSPPDAVNEAVRLIRRSEIPEDGTSSRDVQVSGFLRASDLGMQKLLMSMHGDEGITYKILYRDGARANIYTNSHKAGEGESYKRFAFAGEGVPFDLLPAWLRSFTDGEQALDIAMVNSVVTEGYSELIGERAHFERTGTETVDTPLGPMETTTITVTFLDQEHRFWMAGQEHRFVMVRYEGPEQTDVLQSIELLHGDTMLPLDSAE